MATRKYSAEKVNISAGIAVLREYFSFQDINAMCEALVMDELDHAMRGRIAEALVCMWLLLDVLKQAHTRGRPTAFMTWVRADLVRYLVHEKDVELKEALSKAVSDDESKRNAVERTYEKVMNGESPYGFFFGKHANVRFYPGSAKKRNN
jgi:hypothetical protein